MNIVFKVCVDIYLLVRTYGYRGVVRHYLVKFPIFLKIFKNLVNEDFRMSIENLCLKVRKRLEVTVHYFHIPNDLYSLTYPSCHLVFELTA